MDYVGSLIKRVRRDTQRQVYTKTTGVLDFQIVDLLNEAVRDLVGKISIQNTNFFQKEVILSLGSSGTYDIKGRLLYDSKIVAVQATFSDGSRITNIPYRDIREVGPSRGIAYAVQNGEIVLELSSYSLPNSLTVIYEEKPAIYGQRAGIIVAGTGGGGQVLGVTISYLAPTTEEDFNDAGDLYFTVVDKDGTILMRDVPYTSCTAGVFTMDPYTYEIGETINVGNYVVIGKNATTHIQNISKEHQDYIIAYTTLGVLGMKGASFETQTYIKKRMESLLTTILETHSDPVKDYNSINVVDDDLLGGY